MAWLDKYSNKTPKAQKGKKVKPLYVESENDPRYKAYQDSLNLYNSYKNVKKSYENRGYKTHYPPSERWINVMNDELKKPLPNKIAGYKNDDGTFYVREITPSSGAYYANVKIPMQLYNPNIRPKGMQIAQSTREEDSWDGESEKSIPKHILIDKNKIKKTIKEKSNEGFFTSLISENSTDALPFWDYSNVEPQQEVIIKNTTPPPPPPPIPPIVKRPILENINITPQGLAQTNRELSSNFNIIQQAKTPKYFKVTDKVNQPFGGTETNYKVYPDQDFPSISTQKYPDGTPMNTRKVVPVYQFGGTMFKSPSMVDYEQPRYSYPVRKELYPGEDEYFKANPHVGGMAAEDNQVIINPYSSLSDEEKQGIIMNETARLAMRNGYARPTFDLTPEQKEAFKDYSSNEQDRRETIIGRILSGDPSAGNATPEQKMYAKMLGESLQPISKDEDYDMARALELGYTPDKTGHWNSVDYETGEWLKSKKHHTRGMELMAYELNPELHNAYNLIENEKGKMQYIPKGKNGIEGTMGGLTDKGFNYNGAWGGQFQNGGNKKKEVREIVKDNIPTNSKLKYETKKLITETKKEREDQKEFYNTGTVKNPKSLKYKKQKEELEKRKTYLSQDNRSDYVRKIDEEKGQNIENKKQFKKNILAPLDVATDVMQLGNFIPHPYGQTVGEIGNLLGAGIDTYQAVDDFSEGDYVSGGINSASVLLPLLIQSGGYRRDMYNTTPNTLADDIASLGNRDGTYIHLTPPPNLINNPVIKKGVNFNRALLGTLGAETIYDTPEFQGGGNIPGSVGFTYARTQGIPSEGPYAKKTLPSAQNGVDMYGNPIIANIKRDDSVTRTNYNPRTNTIIFGSDQPLVLSPEILEKTLAHENRHAWQFANDRTNFDMVHNPEYAFQERLKKKPEFPSTDEVFENYHNRKAIESQLDVERVKANNPSLALVPNDIIYNKIVDHDQYSNPNSVEGEAEYYQNTGRSFQNGGEMSYYQHGLDFTPKGMQNGGWLDAYGDDVPKAQVGFYSGNQQKPNVNLANNILKNIQQRKKQAPEKVNLRETPRTVAKDNTAVKKVFNERKFDPNARNKTEQEIEQEIINDRRARIADSIAAQNEDVIGNPNWREVLARQTQATGDKFRISEKPNFFDDWLNPGVWIGDMASALGQAPYQAKETDSYMPYVTSIGVPLLTGGIEGIGAKSTGQFVNNLVNPFNIVPGYKSAEKYLAPKVKKTLAKGALKTLEGAQKLEKLGREAVQSFNDEVIYPFKYRKQIKEIEDLHKNLSTNLGSDEARKRMSKVLGIDVNNLELPSITTRPRLGSHYMPLMNNINIDLRQARQLKKNYMLDPVSIYEHEVGHWMQREANKNSPEYFNKLNQYNNSRSNFFKPIPTSEPTIIDRYAMNLYQHDPVTNLIHYNPSVNSLSHDLIYENAKYFTHNGVEPLAHLREMRQNMLNKGYIKSIYDPISEETINKFIKENPYDRVSSFTTPNSQQTKGLESIFRNLPSVVGAGAVGAGAASQMQQEPSTGMRKGGLIKAQAGKNIRVKNADGTISVMNTDSPEYREMYQSGMVQHPSAGQGKIPYWSGVLDEVSVTRAPREKGFWQQSIDKYLKDNRDAGVLGAIGSVVTYPLSVGQHALTYGTTGKVQDPDEAWGYNTDEGWFDSFGAFGRNLVDASLNLGADPVNLVGVGLADDALKLTSKGKNLFRKGFKKPVDISTQAPGSGNATKKFGLSINELGTKGIVNKNIKEEIAHPFGKKGKAYLRTGQVEYDNGLKLKTYLDPKTKDLNLMSVENPRTRETIFYERKGFWDENFKQNYLNEWNIKADMPTANKDLVKFANQELEKIITVKPIKYEAKNISTDGLRYWKQQQKHGYSSIEDFTEPYISAAGKDDLFKDLKYSNNDDAFESVRFANKKDATEGAARLENFMKSQELDYKVIVNDDNTLQIKLPKLQRSYASGGVIKDDRGQWAHPGEITEIGSNQITMQGVPYPVLGISDTGDVQMMYPGEDYEFDGESVTEFPMAKNGINNLDAKPLQKLNQLTNFTNYNSSSDRGWLSKYE